MTFEVTGDVWTFVRRPDAWVTVLRNGTAFGVLSPRGTRGRDYHWVFRRTPIRPGAVFEIAETLIDVDDAVEIAGVTLVDAKRWVKSRKDGAGDV